MKKIKFILLTIISLSLGISEAQTNELTKDEFSSINFGDINLLDIKATRGDQNLMQSFFENLEIEKGKEPSYWISFSSSFISFLFQDGILVNDNRIYQLTDLSVKDPSICLKLKEIEIRIGDPISILGDVQILTYKDGVREIVYKIGAQVIEIGFDPNTNLITSIKYRYYNT